MSSGAVSTSARYRPAEEFKFNTMDIVVAVLLGVIEAVIAVGPS